MTGSAPKDTGPHHAKLISS